MKYPQHLLKLIEVLKRLPGVGNKSAERFAFQMLNWRSDQLIHFAQVVAETNDKLIRCVECGCLTEGGACEVCLPDRRQCGVICLIASMKDVYAIEETREYKGLYHVLGGLLSPIDGLGPDKLQIERLIERIQKYDVREVVVALDSTLEGDATALYLKKVLSPYSVNVSRLALGLPMGSSLDYIDGGTLARAFVGRSVY